MSDVFPCSQCGACCRIVGRIPESVRGDVVKPDKDGVCVHLKDNECDIYDTRPTICRVDKTKPVWMSMELWYTVNLTACDTLHREVYGTERVPLGDCHSIPARATIGRAHTAPAEVVHG